MIFIILKHFFGSLYFMIVLAFMYFAKKWYLKSRLRPDEIKGKFMWNYSFFYQAFFVFFLFLLLFYLFKAFVLTIGIATAEAADNEDHSDNPYGDHSSKNKKLGFLRTLKSKEELLVLLSFDNTVSEHCGISHHFLSLFQSDLSFKRLSSLDPFSQGHHWLGL